MQTERVPANFIEHLAQGDPATEKVHERLGPVPQNIVDHERREVPQVDVLAELLGVNETIRHYLRQAALNHDAPKLWEKKYIGRVGATLPAFERLEVIQDRLIKKNLRQAVKNIMAGAGVPSFARIQALLREKRRRKIPFSEWRPFEQAQAILHYVDSITIDDTWHESKAVDEKNEKVVNQLDRRSFRQEGKAGNRRLDNDARRRRVFRGESLHEAQRRLGHQLEAIFVERIRQHTDLVINPLDLPEFIDQQIREKIEQG